MSIANLRTSFLKRLRVGTHQDPARDWIVSLIFSSIVLTGIIIWNAWVFDAVSRGVVIGSVATSSPQVLKNSSMSVINGLFEKRAAEEVKYETGAYRFVDPSQ